MQNQRRGSGLLSKIRMRKVNKSDCMDLFRWRNDPVTRKNSVLNTDMVPLEDHKKWFAGKLKSPNSISYIGVSGKNKVGLMRFEIEKDRMIVTVSVNPEYRRMGVGATILGLTTVKMFRKIGKPIIAQIRNHNIPSIKIFTRSGYFIRKKTKDITYMCFNGKRPDAR